LKLRLSRREALVDAVQRVDNQDTDTFTHYQPAGFLQDRVYGIILIARKDVAHIFRKELHRLLVKLLRHPDTGIEAEARQLLNQLTVMIHDGHILGAEIGNLPLVAQAKSHYQLVQPFRLTVRDGR